MFVCRNFRNQRLATTFKRALSGYSTDNLAVIGKDVDKSSEQYKVKNKIKWQNYETLIIIETYLLCLN